MTINPNGSYQHKRPRGRLEICDYVIAIRHTAC
jgi:hypothetical protein